MIRRPLNPRFNTAILAADPAPRKITTIRTTPWPLGVPIMLYNWSGKPYRSPQVDVAAVVVTRTYRIHIKRTAGQVMFFLSAPELPGALWQCEGFASRAEMDAWFAATMKPGQSVTKHLMRFRLATESDLPIS